MRVIGWGQLREELRENESESEWGWGEGQLGWERIDWVKVKVLL